MFHAMIGILALLAAGIVEGQTNWTFQGSVRLDRDLHFFQSHAGSLYAGTPDGLFRKALGAASYERVPEPQYRSAISMAVVGEELFVAYSFMIYSKVPLVLRSSDLGATWVPADSLVATRGAQLMTQVTLHALNGRLYAQGKANESHRPHYLLRYDHVAHRWSDTLPMPQGTIIALESLGGKLFAALSAGTVWSSPDDGVTWEQVFSLPSAAPFSGLKAVGPTLFLGTRQGLYLGTGNGTAWNPSPRPEVQAPVRNVHVLGNGLVIATPASIVHSPDASVTWDSLAAGLGPSDSLFHAGGWELLLTRPFHDPARNTNAGPGWFRQDVPKKDAVLSGLEASGDTVWARTSTGHLMQSSDRGRSWVHGARDSLLHFHLAGTRIYGQDKRGRLLYRTRGMADAPWTRANAASGSYQALVREGGYFYNYGFGVRRYDPERDAWDSLPTPTPSSGEEIQWLAAGDGVLFLNFSKVMESPRWYRSLDHGATWLPFAADITRHHPPMAGDGNLAWALVGMTFHLSLDRGASWSVRGAWSDPGTLNTPLRFFRKGDDLYACCMGGRYRVSRDTARTWTAIALSDTTGITALADGGDALYATDRTGVLRLALGPTALPPRLRFRPAAAMLHGGPYPIRIGGHFDARGRALRPENLQRP